MTEPGHASRPQERIGEIVETETASFIAESFTLHRPPELGRLVRVETDATTHIYGVVCYGTTASPDPGRRAIMSTSRPLVLWRRRPTSSRASFTVSPVWYGGPDLLSTRRGRQAPHSWRGTHFSSPLTSRTVGSLGLTGFRSGCHDCGPKGRTTGSIRRACCPSCVRSTQA